MFTITDDVKYEIRREKQKDEFEEVIASCLKECVNTLEEIEIQITRSRLFPLMQVGCANDRLIVLMEVREILFQKYQRRSRLRKAAALEFVSVLKERISKCITEDQVDQLFVIFHAAQRTTKNDPNYVEKFEAYTEQVKAFVIS